jgi:hypothetical protein
VSGHFELLEEYPKCKVTAQLPLWTTLRPVWELVKLDAFKTSALGGVVTLMLYLCGNGPQRVGSRADLNISKEGKISCLSWDLNNNVLINTDLSFLSCVFPCIVV